MRRVLKKHSTKPERIVYEALKANHISFKHRWLIGGREIDFVVGRVAIEIDGHEQDLEKNNLLLRHGYDPIHIHNDELLKDREYTIQKLICHLQEHSFQTES